MNGEQRVWNGRWESVLRERSVDPAVVQAMQDDGFGKIASRVAVGRLGEAARVLAAPPLSAIQHYRDLPDIELAAKRVANAVRLREQTVLFVDYDTDGCTSGAILMEGLVGLFGARPECVEILVGHRLKDGYGLTDTIVDQLLGRERPPRLLITADCGSADEARIARLKAAGVETVVLDHHEIPAERPPESAYAFVSPKRADSRYDHNIAGCMVALMLMAAVRQALIDTSDLQEDQCTLHGLLEYAALGSLADCVDIGASVTNRAVIRSGMRRMNQGSRACWRVAARALGQAGMRMTSKDLVFGVVPRINAHSRLDEATPGYHYLTAEDDAEAGRWFAMLDAANQERKAIEREMVEQAMVVAQRQVAAGWHAIVVWLPQGHPGVQGIVASRLVDRFARPAACLSPHPVLADCVSGSLRSVSGYSVSRGLDWIRAHGAVLIAGGGHDMAGGVTLRRDALERFSDLLEMSAHAELHDTRMLSTLEFDGVLRCEDINAALIDELASIEPYGQGFRSPVFVVEDACAESLRTIGKEGIHLKLRLRQGSVSVDGVWFFARKDRTARFPVEEGKRYRFAIEPDADWYMGKARVQARIVGVVASD
jgi:single-stranded-DNA-specific exonuclease